MTRLPALAPHRVIGRFPTTVLTVLLTIALLALITTAPAAALRSGPDIALRLGAGVGVGVGVGGGVGAGAGAGRPTGYVPPVAGVDPPSGVERRFDPPAKRWGAGHRGVDLTAPHGSSVLSPGPGVVTFAGQVARRGVLVVTHPDGLRSSLEPVTASVAVGTAVMAGERIGAVEDGHAGGGPTSSHCAPRSCLHWGVRRGERYIDPLSLLYRPPIVLLPDP